MNGFVKFLLILVILTTLGNLVNQVILWAPPVVDSETAGGNGNGTGGNNNQPGGNEETEVQKPIADVQISATVTPDADGKVPAGGVSMNGETASATVPEGVQMEEGATELTLTVNGKEDSEADLDLNENEVSTSLDVHIAGVSTDNAVPMEIKLVAAAVKGLNLGNIRLYHVENGETVEMTRVANDEEFTEHNQFKYDPATGDVTLYMSSFSEVAVVADTVNVWNGNIDKVFTGSGSAEDPYIISNADELAGMSQAVSNDEAYASAHYKLIADINFGGSANAEDENGVKYVFYPIGYWKKQLDENGAELKNKAGESYYGYGNSFSGTFDGNGNTISGIYQNTWLMDGNYDNGYWDHAMGLFGAVWDATIKNLTMDNFQSDGEFTPTGCIAAFAGGTSTFENITLTNCNPRVYNTGNGGIVGLNYNSTSGEADQLLFKNITIDQTNKISALWGSYDVSCGGILGRVRENSKHDGTNTDGQKNTVTFKNCHVAAIMDVNNDVCANYQYYQYRYSGMLIGTVDYIGDVPAVGLEDVVFAEDCTVTYGDWNEYWYCELVKNSLASYTHDHQFSRLTKIGSVSEIQDENGNWNKEGNFVIPAADNSSATCYHIFKDSEGNLYQHNHVDSGYETKDVDGDSQGYNSETGKYLLEDRQRYYLPFGQLFTGYGWGSSPQREFDGITITAKNSNLKAQEKFESTGVNAIPENATVNIGDLFNAAVDPTKISTTTVKVFVSPVGDGSTVSATFTPNTDWTKGTLTFSGTGTAKIVITDYFYCLDTVLNITVGGNVTAIDKFEVATSTATAGSTITLGDLFNAKENVVIDSTSVVINVSGDCTYTQNNDDWTKSTITFGETGTVTITISATGSTETTNNISVIENNSFDTKFENTDKYLYRVGNLSSITLSSLFKQLDSATINGDVTITVVSLIDGTTVLTVTFAKDSWLSGTIDFDDTFTGPVAVTVDALGAKDFVLYLEVVNAKNITSASGSDGTNVVLLNDVKISSNGTANYKNCTVYGNGFTFDVNGGMNQYNSKQGHGIIIINGATLDNLKIIGEVYDEYGMYTTADLAGTLQNDYTSAIDATNSIIQNCYIANCSTPIRANGVTIIDSTLYGGTIANLLITGGTNILTNVTTINYNDGRGVIGMGIVITDGANQDTTKLILNGYLKQHNYIYETDVNDISNTTAQAIINSMFEDQFSNYHFGSSPRAVNTGIVSINENILIDDNVLTDNIKTNYLISNGVKMKIAAQGYGTQTVTAHIASIPASGNSIDNNYVDNGQQQGDYLPTFDFALGSQAQSKDNEDDTNYLIGDKTGLSAMYVDGEGGITIDLTTLSTIYKYTGTNYSVTVSCLDPNGNALTVYNGKVTLVEKGAYTLVFSVEDNIFYDANGNKITKSVTRTYEVPLVLDVYKKSIADATITVSSSELTGEYINSGTNKKYKMYPLQAITSIMDDANMDGTLETFNLKTNIQSAVLTPEGNNAFSSASTITITYTGGQVLTFVLGTPSGLNSPGASNGGKTFSVYTDSTYGIYLQSDGAVASSSAATGTWPITSWSFKGTSGKTVTDSTQVTINFTKPSCVTGDTLVMLADGSQKRIDEITSDDLILVYDHYTGKMAVAPIAFYENNGVQEYEVVTLNFSNGRNTKLIYEHGYFDITLNKYVYIHASDAESFVGHEFAMVDANGNIESVVLESVDVSNMEIGCYSITSGYHYGFIADGMLSIPGAIEGLFNIFEYGENLVYDEEKMAQDIETYGLFTYEDFAAYAPEEAFEMFNAKYFKVSIGKGYVTMEEIIAMIETFFDF